MAGNKIVYCGLAMVVPENKVLVSSRNSGRNKSFETQITSKTLCKDFAGGCSSKITKTQKAGGFVDRRKGSKGYKEEVSHKSSFKVNDKIRGCTTEYETEVKHKKVTTYTKPSKSSGGVKGKKVVTCSNPSKNSGEVMFNKVGTCTKHSKNSGGVMFNQVTTYTNRSKNSSGSVTKKINYYAY